jgi:hypothetical protein
MRHGGVGITQEHLRIGSDHIDVDVRKQTNRVIAADGGDHASHRRIREGFHQIVGTCPRISGEPRRVLERVWHLDDLQAERLCELLFACCIAMRERARSAPRERDGGNGVAASKLLRFDHEKTAGDLSIAGR